MFAQRDRLLFRNGKTAATTQTNPSRQLSAGLCVPESMADPCVKVSRLSGLPFPKQKTFLLGEREGPTDSSSIKV